jgi:collagenase-like PrtC family protease
MKFSVATSWDEELIRSLTGLNSLGTGDRIAEVFGSHRFTLTGTGRTALRLPEVTSEAFSNHLVSADAAGIHFNYLLNARHLGGHENDQDWWKNLRSFLQYIYDGGVSWLTIANDNLLHMVRHEFPNFRIRLSLIAGVADPDAARRYEDEGVSVLCLNPFVVNRDFELIEAIRDAVSCELELYANVSCLDHCPWWQAHYELMGKRSRGACCADAIERADPFLRKCSLRLLASPHAVLSSPFIRPEDVQAYDDIGIDRLKLSDRGESTAFLIATAQAYMQRKYEGDLTDIIFRSGSKFRAALAGTTHEGTKETIPFAIDNAALSRVGFLGGIKGRPVSQRELFYGEVASQAVTWNSEQASRWISMLADANGPVEGPAKRKK